MSDDAPTRSKYSSPVDDTSGRPGLQHIRMTSRHKLSPGAAVIAENETARATARTKACSTISTSQSQLVRDASDGSRSQASHQRTLTTCLKIVGENRKMPASGFDGSGRTCSLHVRSVIELERELQDSWCVAGLPGSNQTKVAWGADIGVRSTEYGCVE